MLRGFPVADRPLAASSAGGRGPLSLAYPIPAQTAHAMAPQPWHPGHVWS